MEERKIGRRKDAKRSVARSVELDWKGSGGDGDLRWSMSWLLGMWVVGYSTGVLISIPSDIYVMCNGV
jgi:hypothetical protein